MAEHELAVIEQKPAEVVLHGKAAATELTKIVSSRKKKLVMAGKQYLFFEDWQTIGKFYGVTAKVVHTEELKEGDTLIGFLAKAVAIVNGVEISGADAECTNDEPNWRKKPRFQLRSMAQTRACAKALRNCLGWVAVLAGYEATPAEEMRPEDSTLEPEPSETISSPTKETKGSMDIEELKESLKTLRGKELKAWSESELLSYMKKIYKVEGETVLECAANLDKGQTAHFKIRIKDALKVA